MRHTAPGNVDVARPRASHARGRLTVTSDRSRSRLTLKLGISFSLPRTLFQLSTIGGAGCNNVIFAVPVQLYPQSCKNRTQLDSLVVVCRHVRPVGCVRALPLGSAVVTDLHSRDGPSQSRRLTVASDLLALSPLRRPRAQPSPSHTRSSVSSASSPREAARGP